MQQRLHIINFRAIQVLFFPFFVLNGMEYEKSLIPNSRQQKLALLTTNYKPMSLADPHNQKVLTYITNKKNYDKNKHLQFNNLTEKEALIVLYTVDYMAETLGRNRNKLVRSLYDFEEKYGTTNAQYKRLKKLGCRNNAQIAYRLEAVYKPEMCVLIHKQKSLNSLENISDQICKQIPQTFQCNDITNIIFDDLPGIYYIKPQWIQELYERFPNLKHLALKGLSISTLYTETFINAHPDSTILLDNLQQLCDIEPKVFSLNWNNGILTVDNCPNLTKEAVDNIECPEKNCFEQFFFHKNGYQIIHKKEK